MSDNVTSNAGSGGAVFATDDVTSVHYPIGKIAFGALDSVTLAASGAGAVTAGVQRVTLASDDPAVAKLAFGSVTGGGVEASALRVTIASDSTGVLSVDDNGSTLSIDDGGGAITVDGTVAVTNAGLTTLAGAVYAEDVASAGADPGMLSMAMRQDTPANTSGTDGDYEPLRMSGGRLWVDASGKTLTVASHAVTNAGTFAVQAAQSGSWTVDLGATDNAVLDTIASPVATISSTPLQRVAIFDAADAQITSFGGGTQYTEDAAAAADPVGNVQILVRKDTPAGITSTDGDNVAQRGSDYGGAYVHILNSSGAIVSSFGGSGGTSMTDDAAFTPATDSITPIGAMFDDVAPDSVNEGDGGVVRMSANRNLYTTLRDAAGNERGLNIDANGEIGVSALRNALPAGTNAIGKLAANSGVDIGDVDITSVIPGSGATNLGKAEDAAHSSGDVGVMALSVRQDTAAALAGTDADYQPLITDASGRLHVNVGNTVTVGSHAVTNAGTFAVQAAQSGTWTISSFGNSTTGPQKAEDVASADADVGIPAMAVRKGTPANTSGTDGDYEFLQMSAGRLWTSATIDAALPAGTNAIGKLASNNGVDIGSVNPVTAANWAIYVEDAGETAGGNLMMAGAVRRDTLASSSGSSGDNSTINTTNVGALWTAGSATNNGGWSVATGSIAATKTDIGSANTAGNVGGWYFYNPNASVAYVQFFNTQASGVTLGTTAPVYSLGIPATSAANVAPGMVGISHSTAICIAVTTTRAGSTGTGSTVDYNIWYKQ